MDWLTSSLAHLDSMTAIDATNDAYDSTVIEKRRNTIIALVEARLNGTSEEEVWKRKDTCARRIYHEKWKKEEIFASTLAEVTKAARTVKAQTALDNAIHKLSLNTEAAVDRVVELIQSIDGQVALRASFGLLDRAGLATAPKGTNAHVGDGGGAVDTEITIRYAED